MQAREKTLRPEIQLLNQVCIYLACDRLCMWSILKYVFEHDKYFLP
jgi:hypothetical protein